MKGLRVSLVVPHYKSQNSPPVYKASLLKEKCLANEIDLVVFPEYFLSEPPLDKVIDKVRPFAEELRTPTLSGVCTKEGYTAAVYVNPDHKADDTKTHVYCKHSSSSRLAYEIPGYASKHDPMFLPITLGVQKIGVMLCHDQFFGLITARLLECGATGLFDLTGDNVQLKKWTNIVQARSIEVGGPFFCTMAYNATGMKGKACTIAYYDGVALEPFESNTEPDGKEGFDIYEWPIKSLHTNVEAKQSYSDKKYSDICISLEGSGPTDIQVKRSGRILKLTGKNPLYKHDQWYGFKTSKGLIGVLPLPIEDIYSPKKLYILRPPQGTFQHHIVIYHDMPAPKDKDRILVMARLRAIEHRVGVGILAGNMREVIKTDNYKHIQRFRGENGVFGLDVNQLGGTYTTYKNAIPKKLFEKYLALV